MDNQPTSGDILEAIHVFAEHTDKQLAEIRQDIVALRTDVTRIDAVMVTKEYLDDKMTDQYGVMLSASKKVDLHVDAVVEILAEHEVISAVEKQQLMAMEPFPKLAA